jgi:hypothetical protein
LPCRAITVALLIVPEMSPPTAFEATFKLAVDTDVTYPLLFTVTTGMAVEEPYVPAGSGESGGVVTA